MNFQKNNLIYVLAGGVNDDITLPLWVKKRCDLALELYKEGDIIVCSSCFTLNKLPKISKKKLVSESSVMKDYIKNFDSKCNVICENISHDTFMSIYLLFDIYMYIFNKCNINIITSEFHGAKVEAILDIIQPIFNMNNKVSLHLSENDMENSLLQDRLMYELQNVKKN